MILLDINAPERAVIRWVANHPSSSLYTATTTQAEMLVGIELVPEDRRRSQLRSAAENMFEVLFAGGAQLATRNVVDFGHCGIIVINPWATE